MPATDYALSEADSGDDLKFRAPMRDGCNVVPLIDGIPTFKAMEIAMAGAKTTVNIAMWLFNADFPLQAQKEVNEALGSGGSAKSVSTWGQLFARLAAKGVKVRVLLSDYDPIVKNDNHRECWAAYSRLRALAGKFVGDDGLQVMCSRHDVHFRGAEVGATLSGWMSRTLDGLIAVLNAGPPANGLVRLNETPGLWPLVTYSKTTGFSRDSAATEASLQVFPVTHHQKVCTVDGSVGFCGGLDPKKGRLDTPLHGTWFWHDTHVQVDRGLAGDLERNFVGRWNTERAVFNAFIAGASAAGKTLTADAVSAITAQRPGAAAAGPASGQLWRTVADMDNSKAIKTNRNGTAIFRPANVRSDVQDGTVKAIGQAQSYIYIENQYVRDTRIFDWLTSTPAAVQIILVLPIAPEEITNPLDLVTKKGVYWEDYIVRRLRQTLGARFGAYSMIAKQKAGTSQPTNSNGSFQLYVHSKLMIIDDEFAMIGSANTNPRSFQVDTEANIAWYDPPGVLKLRQALWREMLGPQPGMDAWAPSDFVTNWNAVAAADQAAAPSARKGFVIPHDETKFPGMDNFGVPDAWTELAENPGGAVPV